MEVTPIGWFLLPLGIALYLFAPARLYPLTVFSVFFSATALINIGSGSSVSGVQAPMFFGALWMAAEMSQLRRRQRSDPRPEIQKSTRRLLLFLGAVLVSLVMPGWINRGIVIESPEFSNPDSAVLQFTFRHITQTVYIVYGVCLSIAVALKNVEVQEFLRTVRVLTISAILISLWGFFQFSCGFLGMTYPAYIFNTSKTDSALGYMQELSDLGLQRVSSVTTEPSLFAQCLLVSLVFVLFAAASSQALISRGWDRFALIVIFGGLLISTSTTAYIGLALIVLLCIPAFTYMRILRPRHAFFLCLFAGGLGALYAGFGTVQDLVNSMLIDKGSSYSGMARLLSVLMARDYFLQYPVLGLGWGSVTSDDLVFKILSNTGIAGLLAFCLFVVSVFVHLWKSARRARANSDLSFVAVSMIVVFSVLIFTNATSGFAYAYSHVWLIFGLAMSVPGFCFGSRIEKPLPSLVSPNTAVVA